MKLKPLEIIAKNNEATIVPVILGMPSFKNIEPKNTAIIDPKKNCWPTVGVDDANIEAIVIPAIPERKPNAT